MPVIKYRNYEEIECNAVRNYEDIECNAVRNYEEIDYSDIKIMKTKRDDACCWAC